jgi:pimeloyl-ACP methyl ester carboxylesterase
MKRMEVFFISGLGADKTVFQFLDLSYCKPVFIDWLDPEKNESLQHYALRLKDKFLPDDATIVGLSFGGMIATEIGKQYPSVKPILISSAKTKAELPKIYSTGKFFPLHQWSPYKFQKWFMLRIKKLFGINTKKVRQIYEEIIRNSNPAFNIWAVDAILNWNNSEVPGNIVHIHGTHDLVLPYKYVQCNYAVKKGGHLMIMEQADILSGFLRNVITNKEVNFSTLSSSGSQPAFLYPV